MDISGNPVLSRSPAPSIDSQSDANKEMPTIWGRIIKVAVPVLSIAGFITGSALVFTVAPILGAVLAVASASVLIGKCLYDRFVRKAPDVNPEFSPGPYVQKKLSANSTASQQHSQQHSLQNHDANELTYFPSLYEVMKEYSDGASGAKVYQVRDNNNRLMVLKIHRHAPDVSPNFLLNEGRVQQQVSQDTKGLLPAVHLHGSIKGEKLTGLINDPSFIQPDEKYSVILSDCIEHKSLLDLSSSSERPSPGVFRSALTDFARNMRDSVRKHQFEHNDLSRNLIYDQDGRILVIDTGLSATRDYAYQGEEKGNPFMNIGYALDIAYHMAGSNLNDPFYNDMKIGQGLNYYWNSIKNPNDSVDFDLAEFNTLLLYFPDIRQKIILGGNLARARLLSWEECIAALDASPGI